MNELENLPPLRRDSRYYRWSHEWACWIPKEELLSPARRAPIIDAAALVPYSPKHRCNSLDCEKCCNMGVRMADYLKAKKLAEL